MKIVSTSAMRRLDAYTIANEPIASIDLMERAAHSFYRLLTAQINTDRAIYCVAGPGNNGGDALAIARLLYLDEKKVDCVLVTLPGQKCSDDCLANQHLWEKATGRKVVSITSSNDFPTLPQDCLIIDGLFGSGLNRPLVGLHAQCVQWINNTATEVVAIDIPSGLFAENNQCNDPKSIIRATHTFSFQLPKLAFFFAENYRYVGQWQIADIGLSPQAINDTDTSYFYTTAEDCRKYLKPREKFAHKGTFGHALLVAGSWGKVGAAILAAKACLRIGVGKLSIHAPACAYTILQTSVPEAMVEYDSSTKYIGSFHETAQYNAVGIGPGLDTYPLTAYAVEQLFINSEKPLVIDADAINLLSQNRSWLKDIPSGSILTPHPKEFDRLAGESISMFERFEKAKLLSSQHHLYIVLKGAHTMIITPEGKCYFNSTGNPGMATGGSGDVLTGILTGLIAQGYTSLETAILGVWLHGRAGDLASESLGEESLIASDIIRYLPKAIQQLHSDSCP